MKRHYIIIIGGFCYLILFLIIGLNFIGSAYSEKGLTLCKVMRQPQNLVIGLVLISQALIVFVTAVFYASKTRTKD